MRITKTNKANVYRNTASSKGISNKASIYQNTASSKCIYIVK